MARSGWAVPAAIIHDPTGWSAVFDERASGPVDDPTQLPDIERIWTTGTRISAEEYDWLLAIKDHARTHDPDHPSLHPTRAVDLARTRPLLPSLGNRTDLLHRKDTK